MIPLLVRALLLIMLAGHAAAADITEQPPRTQVDVAYGPHPRNVLDFWKASGEGPRPLLVYIHGGGWITGDKSQKMPVLQPFLDRGISCAAINYRLAPDHPLPAPVHDAARAVQFLRSKAADWNIRTDRIALTGPSAGGCTAMWLLLHDDLADPDAADLVARESTRVWAAAAEVGQTSIDPKILQEWLGPAVLHEGSLGSSRTRMPSLGPWLRRVQASCQCSGIPCGQTARQVTVVPLPGTQPLPTPASRRKGPPGIRTDDPLAMAPAPSPEPSRV